MGEFELGMAASMAVMKQRAEARVVLFAEAVALRAKSLAHYDPNAKPPHLRDTIGVTVGVDELGFFAEVGTSDPVGLYDEFGTSKMARRPFMRPAIAESEHTIA